MSPFCLVILYEQELTSLDLCLLLSEAGNLGWITNPSAYCFFLVSLIFLLAKFIEMRFIDKENKPLKLLMRDTLLVYCCVIVGHFVFQQCEPDVVKKSIPIVFTDSPEF